MGGKTTKCFEYMAAGIPFMVSDFLIQDVLDKWSCGVSADAANMDDMVQKAVYLLESPAMAANMGNEEKLHIDKNIIGRMKRKNYYLC